MFRHDARDACLFAQGVFHVTLLLTATLYFGFWPLAFQVAVAVLLLYLHLTNVNAVSHSFIHHPFFRWEPLNRLFSMVNTVAIGFPQEAYRIVHFNHHNFNNDRPDASGHTRDKLSIYRFGKEGRAENVFRFVVGSHFRLDLRQIYQKLSRQRRLGRAFFELAFLVGLLCCLREFNGKGVVWFYIPLQLLGWTLTFAESYFEHYGANTDNRLGNAVSCYNPIYNFLWYNNGYHMEHHYRPDAHWSQLPNVRAQFEDQFRANGYRTIRGAHLFSLFQPLAQNTPAFESSDRNSNLRVEHEQAIANENMSANASSSPVTFASPPASG